MSIVLLLLQPIDLNFGRLARALKEVDPDRLEPGIELFYAPGKIRKLFLYLALIANVKQPKRLKLFLTARNLIIKVVPLLCQLLSLALQVPEVIVFRGCLGQSLSNRVKLSLKFRLFRFGLI